MKEEKKVNEKTFESNLKDLEDLVKELEREQILAVHAKNKILASDGELKDFETPEN